MSKKKEQSTEKSMSSAWVRMPDGRMLTPEQAHKETGEALMEMLQAEHRELRAKKVK